MKINLEFTADEEHKISELLTALSYHDPLTIQYSGVSNIIHVAAIEGIETRIARLKRLAEAEAA